MPLFAPASVLNDSCLLSLLWPPSGCWLHVLHDLKLASCSRSPRPQRARPFGRCLWQQHVSGMRGPALYTMAREGSRSTMRR